MKFNSCSNIQIFSYSSATIVKKMCSFTVGQKILDFTGLFYFITRNSFKFRTFMLDILDLTQIYFPIVVFYIIYFKFWTFKDSFYILQSHLFDCLFVLYALYCTKLDIRSVLCSDSLDYFRFSLLSEIFEQISLFVDSHLVSNLPSI